MTIEITDELLAKAEALAAQGLTQAQIAKSLGMGESTLYEKIKEFPEFLKALDGGKAKGLAKVSTALFKLIDAGHFPAVRFYLITRDKENWSETIQIDATVEDITDHAANARAKIEAGLISSAAAQAATEDTE